MSLVSTYVLADDGYWYKNPALGTGSWFLCYDDDEPIEIVMKEGKHTLEEILSKLKAHGYTLEKYGKGYRRCTRVFSDDDWSPAIACFVKHTGGVMPVALLRHGYYEHEDTERFKTLPPGDKVYYPALKETA